MNLNSSDGVAQAFATQIASNTEHRMPNLDVHLDSCPNPSNPGVLNAGIQPPTRYDPSLIPNDHPPTNGPEFHSIQALQMQPSQPNQQFTASPKPASTPGASLGHKGSKTPKHQCDNCDKSFRRRNLLRDHMRTHTGEETRGGY